MRQDCRFGAIAWWFGGQSGRWETFPADLILPKDTAVLQTPHPHRAHGRFYNVVDLVNRLETETRGHKHGPQPDYRTRRDVVILDKLGRSPFARFGGQVLFHLIGRLTHKLDHRNRKRGEVLQNRA